MKTVNSEYEAFYEVNRSKFYAFLVPYREFDTFHRKLRWEHPKANHIVWAYRKINEYDQIQERSNDDGEPKGCAGVPVLNVLRGNDLVACGVLIVRYFGGIKLGTGGMARAYAQAAKTVVSQANLIDYVKTKRYRFETDYKEIDKTLYRLKRCGITRFERRFEAQKVIWTIEVSQEEFMRFESV